MGVFVREQGDQERTKNAPNLPKTRSDHPKTLESTTRLLGNSLDFCRPWNYGLDVGFESENDQGMFR